MKALNKQTGQLEKVYVKALDSMPVGTIVEFNGQASDIPSGWEETTDPNSYSTSEVKTDKTWIDDKPIYRKTIAYTGAALSSGMNNIQHNISNIGTHREIVASEFWYNNNMWNGFISPTSYCTANAVNSNTIDVSISDSFAGLFSPVYITLEYTKTTD